MRMARGGDRRTSASPHERGARIQALISSLSVARNDAEAIGLLLREAMVVTKGRGAAFLRVDGRQWEALGTLGKQVQLDARVIADAMAAIIRHRARSLAALEERPDLVFIPLRFRGWLRGIVAVREPRFDAGAWRDGLIAVLSTIGGATLARLALEREKDRAIAAAMDREREARERMLDVDAMRVVSERRSEQLSRLFLASAGVARATTERQFAALALDAGVKVFGAGGGAVAVCRKGGGLAMLGTGQHVPPASLLAEVVRTREGRWDVEARDDLLREIPGTKRATILPLLHGDEVVGAIAWTFARSAAASPEDAGFALSLADRCALALENLRLLHETEEARTRAEAANREKDWFVARVSHELRAPLAPILMWTEILRDSLPAKQRAPVLAIEQAARDEIRLVDDLLDATRGMTRKMRIEREPLDLRDPVRRAIDSLKPAFAQKRLRFTCTIPRSRVSIVGDALRLEQVVRNLLGNACKFTPPGGTVRLTLARERARATLTVADSGAGFSPADRKRLFEPFWQAEGTRAEAGAGLGLGLAIVREFAELHGGEVDAHSRGPGKGATFRMRVPLAPPVRVGRR